MMLVQKFAELFTIFRSSSSLARGWPHTEPYYLIMYSIAEILVVADYAKSRFLDITD